MGHPSVVGHHIIPLSQPPHPLGAACSLHPLPRSLTAHLHVSCVDSTRPSTRPPLILLQLPRPNSIAPPVRSFVGSWLTLAPAQPATRLCAPSRTHPSRNSSGPVPLSPWSWGADQLHAPSQISAIAIKNICKQMLPIYTTRLPPRTSRHATPLHTSLVPLRRPPPPTPTSPSTPAGPSLSFQIFFTFPLTGVTEFFWSLWQCQRPLCSSKPEFRPSKQPSL